MIKFEHTTTLDQNIKLSQSQLQSLKILALDNCELNSFLQTEYIENPLMDNCKYSELPSWDQYSTPSGNDEEICNEIPDSTKDGIKEYLLDQLNKKDFSNIQWKICNILIDCLDDNGYFKLSINDISQWLEIDSEIAKSCLDILSSLEPCGIFAKDLAHCLIMQLEKAGELTPELNNIIRYHLDDIAAGKINVITKSLSMSTQEVRKCIAKIRDLNPRPLSSFSIESTNYIVPDIILNYHNGDWSIYMNDQWIVNYTISDCYLNMMKTVKDPELKTYFQQKYARYQFIMNSIEQRRNTILKISNAIFERQKDYFTQQGPLKPMTLMDIANTINMHPSTVSRGIKNKYLQHPAGVIGLKDLFVSSASKDCDNSSSAVKERIKELINTENILKPYSDYTLVTILKKENIDISRRTVSKYREEMGIQSTYSRKQVL